MVKDRENAQSRGIALGRQNEVEGVGIAGHDDAVVRCGQDQVIHPGLQPLLLALGRFQRGFGDPDVDLGLRQRGPPRDQLGVSLQNARNRRVSRWRLKPSTDWSICSRSCGVTTPRLTSPWSRLTSESQRSASAR